MIYQGLPSQVQFDAKNEGTIISCSETVTFVSNFFSGVYNNSFQSSKSRQMLKADYPVYKNWELVSMWVYF
ncbi:hypothetical protein OUZ56_024796 [Daphnia magna]|uniref:Uncharacterized protein n=1 Tax=Daphnia magna TaxID=35525 RepID=A0ABQ9ZI15_9CRUS|nr:hypothetical protein OUZ56_024796 [Daphnia magna]